MERERGRLQKQKKITEVKTYPVSVDLEKIKATIPITTNSASEISKVKIINQAFRLHSEGNIEEAAKYYQYFIDQGFNDERVFSNYGVLLRQLEKLQEAEIFYRKAITLTPDYAEAYYNLGNLLLELSKVQEAKKTLQKAIELKPDFVAAKISLESVLVK